MTGLVAGRSVTHINNTGSKEAQLNQSYLNSSIENQLRNNYVNTVKNQEHICQIESRAS